MFESLLKKLALGLEQESVPYMIFGGQAVLLYGEPRITRDIDVTLGLDAAQPEPILRLIKLLRLIVLVDEVEDFLRQTFVLPVLDPESNIRIDFVFSLSEFERQAIKRSKQVAIGNVKIRFVSLEDLIILKIFAGRPRDLEDVKSLIKKNPGFDRSFVETSLQDFDSELDIHCLHSFNQIMQELSKKDE
ncbi:MAG: nucleotidyl transferase AbiEii/AbiGii toxin family protein [Thermoguttaceae bacterium]